MLNRAAHRKRRATKARIVIRQSGRPRVCIHKSLRHFYAQLIVPGEKGDRVLATASSVEPEFKTQKLASNNVQLAQTIGSLLAKRVLALNIKQVALDRSGNKYHIRLQGFKEAAMQGGLEF